MEKNKRIELFEEMVGDIVSDEMKAWLIEKGFFESPASTKYHGAYPGGLFDHSFLVASKLMSMTENLGFQWSRPESPIIVGIFHDLCKIDNYKKGENIPSEAVESEKHLYEYNTNCILKGHGDKSVMLLSQFMTLTMEEILCIRFHMGAYEKESWNEWDRAIKEFETVLWTHTADMYASKVQEC